MRIRSAVVLVAVAALAAGCSDDAEPEVVRPPRPVDHPAGLRRRARAGRGGAGRRADRRHGARGDRLRPGALRAGLRRASAARPTARRAAARSGARPSARRRCSAAGCCAPAGGGTRALRLHPGRRVVGGALLRPVGRGLRREVPRRPRHEAASSAPPTRRQPPGGRDASSPSAHLVAAGRHDASPTESWAAEPELVALVGAEGGRRRTSRATACTVDEAFGSDVSGDLAPTPAADLGALERARRRSRSASAARLVTARLGPGARATSSTGPGWPRRCRRPTPSSGSATASRWRDPSSGRIGYQLGDGPVAARLAHERQLPFAVCGS